MSNSLHFVTVTNLNSKPVFLIPPHEKTPAPGEVQLREKIKLEPGRPSHPLPYDLLTKTRNWKSLVQQKSLEVRDVTFEPAFARVENRSAKPIQLEVMLPGKADGESNKGTESKVRRVVLEPGQTSTPLCLAGVSNLSSVAGSVSVELAGYIGPPAHSGGRDKGSFGSEPVYYCYKCGGPIVFRTNGCRHPVHI